MVHDGHGWMDLDVSLGPVPQIREDLSECSTILAVKDRQLSAISWWRRGSLKDGNGSIYVPKTCMIQY